MMDNLGLAKKAFGPIMTPALGRRQIADYQTYFDLLDEGVTLNLGIPPGTPLEREYRGKPNVVRFFSSIMPDLFEDIEPCGPPEYLCTGSRVVVLGRENYTIKKRGIPVREKAFAVMLEFREGLIVGDLQVKEMMEFIDVHRHG